MEYKKMLKQVAKKYNTTPEEVEEEMKKAITASGFDMSPQLFISLCTAKVKKTIYRK